MSEAMDDVIGHLLFATDLLQEEVAHAPNTATACLSAGYLSDIYRVIQRISEDEWNSGA